MKKAINLEGYFLAGTTYYLFVAQDEEYQVVNPVTNLIDFPKTEGVTIDPKTLVPCTEAEFNKAFWDTLAARNPKKGTNAARRAFAAR